MSGTTTMLHLPHEIISDILSRLPFEDALHCKELCKTWRNLLRHMKRDQKINLLRISKRGSGDMQLYHAEYDEKSNKNIREQLSYDALTPLGWPSPYLNINNELRFTSHRGLVCFHEANYNDASNPLKKETVHPIYICNPFKQETVRLPELPNLPEDATVYRVVSGFGYLYATNEYKIVRIYYKECSPSCKGQVHVYTLGDKSGWRNKGTTDRLMRRSNGILSDGALHWISGTKIVSFNLADEKFRFVPVPPCIKNHLKRAYPQTQLLTLGGYLSVVLSPESGTTDIWSLKETKNIRGYTVKQDWSKEFTIRSVYHYKYFYNPFALTEEKKILMWINRTTLRHYDPKTATSEEFSDETSQNFQVLPYMKSDVSITALVPHLQVVNWIR